MDNIEQVVKRFRDHVSYDRIGVSEGEEITLSYYESLGQVMAIEADARAAREDLDQLLHHRCEWSENDYCNICGADGRA